MKKLKVLHLLQSSHFSGAENVVIQIIEMFKDKNTNINMAYCSPDGQIRETLDERMIKFFPISKLSINEVKRVIKEYRPDIIHAHDAYASVIAAYFGRSITIISHMHGNHENLRKICIKSILYAWCSKKFKHIFWVSSSSYNNFFFKKHASSISSILYNVLDKKSVVRKMNQDLKDYEYDIVYVGRLTYPKNPERLIKVLELVISEHREIKVAILGTGDLLESTKDLATSLGLENNIFFLGFQNNPLKIMNDAKVMIMTSRFEGTPMCALEAMLLGVPIVSTPTDGLVELITHGETGFLSENNEELAKYIVQIIENNDLYSFVSSNSQQKGIKLNNLDSYYLELKQIYEKVYKT